MNEGSSRAKVAFGKKKEKRGNGRSLRKNHQPCYRRPSSLLRGVGEARGEGTIRKYKEDSPIKENAA